MSQDCINIVLNYLKIKLLFITKLNYFAIYNSFNIYRLYLITIYILK